MCQRGKDAALDFIGTTNRNFLISRIEYIRRREKLIDENTIKMLVMRTGERKTIIIALLDLNFINESLFWRIVRKSPIFPNRKMFRAVF